MCSFSIKVWWHLAIPQMHHRRWQHSRQYTTQQFKEALEIGNKQTQSSHVPHCLPLTVLAMPIAHALTNRGIHCHFSKAMWGSTTSTTPIASQTAIIEACDAACQDFSSPRSGDQCTSSIWRHVLFGCKLLYVWTETPEDSSSFTFFDECHVSCSITRCALHTRPCSNLSLSFHFSLRTSCTEYNGAWCNLAPPRPGSQRQYN
eukprot:scpid97434/ scgid0010/ 